MLRAQVHEISTRHGGRRFHDAPGGGARDVRATAAAERRLTLINPGTMRIPTVRASPRNASFDARSPVPCLFDARIDPREKNDLVSALVLRRDVQALACRTLPRHAGGSAAARRGQRRQAGVARSGQDEGGTHGSLGLRLGTAVWPLARAFYRHGGVAAN